MPSVRLSLCVDWLKNIDLRRRANAGLNKGEARNALARAIFFYRLGEMRDRSFESQVYRASGLNLLIAAIILWNTRYLELTFVELERQGLDVSPTIVAHVAPLGWEHVGLTGDYVWSDGQQPSNGSLRPLRRRVKKKLMPHNFFWKRACIEARDHGEPSRAVKSAEREGTPRVQRRRGRRPFMPASRYS
jgi:hypothetical protein